MGLRKMLKIKQFAKPVFAARDSEKIASEEPEK
jgi:hypothetical protein